MNGRHGCCFPSTVQIPKKQQLSLLLQPFGCSTLPQVLRHNFLPASTLNRARAENAWFGGHPNGLYGRSGNSDTPWCLKWSLQAPGFPCLLHWGLGRPPPRPRPPLPDPRRRGVGALARGHTLRTAWFSFCFCPKSDLQSSFGLSSPVPSAHRKGNFPLALQVPNPV